MYKINTYETTTTILYGCFKEFPRIILLHELFSLYHLTLEPNPYVSGDKPISKSVIT